MRKNLYKNIHDSFDIFPTLQCSLDNRVKMNCDILKDIKQYVCQSCKECV